MTYRLPRENNEYEKLIHPLATCCLLGIGVNYREVNKGLSLQLLPMTHVMHLLPSCDVCKLCREDFKNLVNYEYKII
jgi:hypothetical protein